MHDMYRLNNMIDWPIVECRIILGSSREHDTLSKGWIDCVKPTTHDYMIAKLRISALGHVTDSDDSGQFSNES